MSEPYYKHSWVKRRDVSIWSGSCSERGRQGTQKRQNGERLLRTYPCQDHFSVASTSLPASLWRKRSGGDLNSDSLSQSSSSSSSGCGTSNGTKHSATVMEVPKDLDAMFDSKMPGLSIAMVRPETRSVAAGTQKNGVDIRGEATGPAVVHDGEGLTSSSDVTCGPCAVSDAEKADVRGVAGGKLSGVGEGKLSGVARGKLLRCSPARNPVEFDVSLIGSSCQERKVSPSSLRSDNSVLVATSAEVSRKDSVCRGLGRGRWLQKTIESRPDVIESICPEKENVTEVAKPLVSARLGSSPVRNPVKFNTSSVDYGCKDEMVRSKCHLRNVSEASGTFQPDGVVSAGVDTAMAISKIKGLGRGQRLQKIIENRPDMVLKSIDHGKNSETKLEESLVSESSKKDSHDNKKPVFSDKDIPSPSVVTRRSSGMGRGKLLQRLVAETGQAEVDSSEVREKSHDGSVKSGALSAAELDGGACHIDPQPTAHVEASGELNNDDDDDDLCIGTRTKAEVEQRIVALQKSVRIHEMEFKKITRKNEAMENEFESEMKELEEENSEPLPYVPPDRLCTSAMAEAAALKLKELTIWMPIKEIIDFDSMIHLCGNSRVAAMAISANKAHKDLVKQKCSNLLGNNKLARLEFELVVQEEAMKKQLKVAKMENAFLQKKLDFYVNCH